MKIFNFFFYFIQKLNVRFIDFVLFYIDRSGDVYDLIGTRKLDFFDIVVYFIYYNMRSIDLLKYINKRIVASNKNNYGYYRWLVSLLEITTTTFLKNI